MANRTSYKIRAWFVAISAVTVFWPVLRAQVADIPPTAASIPRRSSKEVMERPIALTNAAGKLHQKVTTGNAEAQAYYDQGVANLHNYVWVDAARSFHEALRRDPELAMAHLGLAKAHANADSWGDAFAHQKKAEEPAAKVKLTPKEAKWIELGRLQLNAIFAASAERTQKHQQYKTEIEELIAMDPDDAHAWVLRGNAEEGRPNGRGQGGGVGAIAFYEAALRHDPNNWAADHYLIHAYEGLGYYEKSGQHGKRYADAVAGVPHAQHMYAHILPRLGKWEEAAAQLSKADRLQREYFASGIAPIDEWHHGHNTHLLGVSNLRLGNVKEAERLLKEAFDLDVRGVRDGRFTDPWLEYLLMRGRYQEALTASQEAEKRPFALARVIGAVRGAEALIALKRLDEARAAQQRAKDAFQEFVKDTENPIYDRLRGSYEQSHLRVLETEFALVGDNPKAAEEQLIKFADGFVGQTNFDGWATGLFRLEQLAGLAQLNGRGELVAAILERMRRIDPTFVSQYRSATAPTSAQTTGQP
jgi:tetratricopeptide (TPR) repeat protein